MEEPNEVLKAFLFNDDRKEMEQNKDGLYLSALEAEVKTGDRGGGG